MSDDTATYVTTFTIDVRVGRDHPLLDEIAWRVAEAAREHGLDAVIGAETTEDHSGYTHDPQCSGCVKAAR